MTWTMGNAVTHWSTWSSQPMMVDPHRSLCCSLGFPMMPKSRTRWFTQDPRKPWSPHWTVLVFTSTARIVKNWTLKHLSCLKCESLLKELALSSRNNNVILQAAYIQIKFAGSERGETGSSAYFSGRWIPGKLIFPSTHLFLMSKIYPQNYVRFGTDWRAQEFIYSTYFTVSFFK